MDSEPAHVTQMLNRAGSGDSAALQDLLPLVYDELRGLARAGMARERADHTLQPTALAHEVFLKLVDQSAVQWQGRAHFFALAARAIRRVLVDHARGKQRAKRGGRVRRAALAEVGAPAAVSELEIVDLDDALAALAELDQRQARIAEMHVFGGLTLEEAAEVVGVSLRTAAADWRMAKAWLRRELAGSPAE